MRLSQDRKNQIVRNAMQDTFKARSAALAADMSQIATLAYNSLYPAETVRDMARLPDEFFGQKSFIYIKVPGFDSKGFALISSRKVSAYHLNEYKGPKWDPTDAESIAAVKTVLAADKKLEADKELFKSQMHLFLRGINTDKQLRDQWPEGEALYQGQIGVPVKNAIAVRADSVNSMIAQMKA